MQVTIKQQAAEIERLKEESAMHARVAQKAIDDVVQVKAERDALQAKLAAMEAVDQP
jgi:hypothetical protein